MEPQLARNDSDALAAWATLDAARALHPADHLSLRSTEPARSLVIDLLGAGAERDLWNACARLGRMMADEGASPSLAAGTIDNAAAALGVNDAARIAPARASLIEGYVASIREAERSSAVAAWDYPSCVVRIDDGVVAIACGRPTDDGDALTAWAERVASKLSKAKVKRAILEGGEVARAELASALELVGIALGPAPAPKSWLPWKR
ncbi:MAG: hypothetical protein U0270_10765 [Labilithrix sp.]